MTCPIADEWGMRTAGECSCKSSLECICLLIAVTRYALAWFSSLYNRATDFPNYVLRWLGGTLLGFRHCTGNPRVTYRLLSTTSAHVRPQLHCTSCAPFLALPSHLLPHSRTFSLLTSSEQVVLAMVSLRIEDSYPRHFPKIARIATCTLLHERVYTPLSFNGLAGPLRLASRFKRSSLDGLCLILRP